MLVMMLVPMVPVAWLYSLNTIYLQAPHAVHMRNGLKFGDATITDTMMKDGLTDAINNIHMGITGMYVLHANWLLCVQ